MAAYAEMLVGAGEVDLSEDDQGVLEAAREFRRSTMAAFGVAEDGESAGFCYVVSAALCGYLRFLNFPGRMTEGGVEQVYTFGVARPAYSELAHHWWITLGEGRILDATADQFFTPAGERMPQVYLGALPPWYEEA